MIWAFFSKRLRLWLVFAVGVPLLRRLLGRAGETVEARSGQNRVSRGLKAGSRGLSRFERKAHRRAS